MLDVVLPTRAHSTEHHLAAREGKSLIESEKYIETLGSSQRENIPEWQHKRKLSHNIPRALQYLSSLFQSVEDLWETLWNGTFIDGLN